MPSFEATVELIDVYYPRAFRKAADIYLRKADGYRLCAESYRPAEEDVQFVRSLKEEQSYVFPQVLLEYRQSRQQAAAQGQALHQNPSRPCTFITGDGGFLDILPPFVRCESDEASK